MSQESQEKRSPSVDEAEPREEALTPSSSNSAVYPLESPQTVAILEELRLLGRRTLEFLTSIPKTAWPDFIASQPPTGEAAPAEVQTLQVQLAEVTTSWHTALQERQVLEGLVGRLTAETEELRQQLLRQSHESQRRQLTAEEITEQLHKLQQLLKGHHQEKQRLEQRLSELTQELQESFQTQENLEAEITGLRIQLQTIQQQLLAAQKAQKKAEKRQHELEQRLAKKGQKLEPVPTSEAPPSDLNELLAIGPVPFQTTPKLPLKLPRSVEFLPNEPWDKIKEFRHLINHTPELQNLYDNLGFSLEAEARVTQLLHDLNAEIVAEIPDFNAFQNALLEIQAQWVRSEQEDAASRSPFQTKYHHENHELLNAVIAAGDDQPRVLEIINRDPVNSPLPFVEQLPFLKEGRVIWRTPIELSIIRKRPRDLMRFTSQLEALEELVRTLRLPRREQIRKEVMEALGRIRRDLQRENAYVPTALKLLSAKLWEWLKHSASLDLQKKREQLDSLLLDMLEARHEYTLAYHSSSQQTRERDMKGVDGLTSKQAKHYLDSPWMQTSWLTTYLLTNLLDAELTPLIAEAGLFAAPLELLKRIRDEVASGYYDSDETIRHLRQEEEKGLYISSLIYALLRLNRSTASLFERKKMIDNLAEAIEKGDLI